MYAIPAIRTFTAAVWLKFPTVFTLRFTLWKRRAYFSEKYYLFIAYYYISLLE